MPDNSSPTPISHATKIVETSLPMAALAPGQVAPGLTPYATNVKNPIDIKSPQLPFGENVAVATGVGGP